MSPLRDALQELPDAVFADLLEADDAYLLVLDLPGVTAEPADIRTESGRLVVEARRGKSVPPGVRYPQEDRPRFLDAGLPRPRAAPGSAGTAETARRV